MSCREEFKVSEIQIGKEGNKIYFHPNGDMMFRDDVIPGIRLRDLAGIGEDVIIDPAIIVLVESIDWTETVVDGQTIYVVTITHNFSSEPYSYFVELADTDGVNLTLNKVAKSTNTLVLETTVAMDLYVSIKRIF